MDTWCLYAPRVVSPSWLGLVFGELSLVTRGDHYYLSLSLQYCPFATGCGRKSKQFGYFFVIGSGHWSHTHIYFSSIPITNYFYNIFHNQLLATTTKTVSLIKSHKILVITGQYGFQDKIATWSSTSRVIYSS